MKTIHAPVLPVVQPATDDYRQLMADLDNAIAVATAAQVVAYQQLCANRESEAVDGLRNAVLEVFDIVDHYTQISD